MLSLTACVPFVEPIRSCCSIKVRFCLLYTSVSDNFDERIDQKIFHAEIVVDVAKVSAETKAYQMCIRDRKIARALTNRFENRHTKTLFSERLNGLTEHEQAKADEWWNRICLLYTSRCV